MKKNLLYLQSENEGQIYNVVNNKLYFLKFIKIIDLKTSKVIKFDFIIIGASLLSWKKSSTKKIDDDINSFGFNDSTVHETKDLVWTKQNIDQDTKTVFQAWIKNDRLHELLRKWRLSQNLTCYAEPLCFSFSGKYKYWFSGNLKLGLSNNGNVADILANNIEPSNDILPDDLTFLPQGAKFLTYKKQNKFISSISANLVFWPITLALFIAIIVNFSLYLKFKKQENYALKNVEYLQNAPKTPALDSFFRLATFLNDGSLKMLKINNSGNELFLELSIPPKISNEKIKEMFLKDEIKISQSKDSVLIYIVRKNDQ